jgi:hypothetical protein
MIHHVLICNNQGLLFNVNFCSVLFNRKILISKFYDENLDQHKRIEWENSVVAVTKDFCNTIFPGCINLTLGLHTRNEKQQVAIKE